MTKSIDEFNQYREEVNERILSSNHLGIKRFFALDHQAYEGGALDSKTKELLGLVASLVLRCDDCITYHSWKVLYPPCVQGFLLLRGIR